jgi:hypothetical protein
MTLYVPLPVPPAPGLGPVDGPIMATGLLASKKTVYLGGDYLGAYDILGSHDGVAFVPVASFSQSDPKKSKSVNGTFAFMRVRRRATAPVNIVVGAESTCACNAVPGHLRLLDTDPKSCVGPLPCSSSIIQFVFNHPVAVQSFRRSRGVNGGTINCPGCTTTGTLAFDFGNAAGTLLPSVANVAKFQIRTDNLLGVPYKFDVTVLDLVTGEVGTFSVCFELQPITATISPQGDGTFLITFSAPVNGLENCCDGCGPGPTPCCSIRAILTILGVPAFSALIVPAPDGLSAVVTPQIFLTTEDPIILTISINPNPAPGCIVVGRDGCPVAPLVESFDVGGGEEG